MSTHLTLTLRCDAPDCHAVLVIKDQIVCAHETRTTITEHKWAPGADHRTFCPEHRRQAKDVTPPELPNIRWAVIPWCERCMWDLTRDPVEGILDCPGCGAAWEGDAEDGDPAETVPWETEETT